MSEGDFANPDELIAPESSTSRLARVGLLGASGAASATAAYEAVVRHVVHEFVRDLFAVATAGLDPAQMADWVQRHPYLVRGHGLERWDVLRYNLRHLTTRAVPSPTLNYKGFDATIVNRVSREILERVDYKSTANAAKNGVSAHLGTGVTVRAPKGIVVPGATSATVSAEELERLYVIASRVGPTLHQASMTAARRTAIVASALTMAGGAYRIAQGRETWAQLGPDLVWVTAEAAAAGYAGTAIGGVAAAATALLFTAPAWVPVVVGAGVTIGVGLAIHKGATAIRETATGQLIDAIIGEVVGLIGKGVERVGLDDLALNWGLDRLILTVGDAVKKVPSTAKKVPVVAKAAAKKVPAAVSTAGANAVSNPLAAGSALGVLALLAPTPTLRLALPAAAIAGFISYRRWARRQERTQPNSHVPDLRVVDASSFRSDDQARGSDDSIEGVVA